MAMSPVRNFFTHRGWLRLLPLVRFQYPFIQILALDGDLAMCSIRYVFATSSPTIRSAQPLTGIPMVPGLRWWTGWLEQAMGAVY